MKYPPHEDGKDARIILLSTVFMSIKRIAYWAADGSSRYGYFDSTVARKSVNTSFGQ